MPRINVTLKLRDFGACHAHEMRSDGSVGPRRFTAFDWMSGWTTVRTFTVDNAGSADPYLFALNSNTGDALIHRLGDDGTIGPEVWSNHGDPWTTGWTTASFYTIYGTTYLFLLKQGNGRVHIHRMNDDGTIGPRVWNRDWSSGWTTAEAFTVGTATYLFLLKEATGDVHIHRLDDSDGTVGARVLDTIWSSDWTTAAFYRLGNVTYLFLLKASTGRVHIHRMNVGGTVGERVAEDNWTSGWTTAVPFTVGGSPFLFLLKESNGSVHIHPIRSDGTLAPRVDDRDWTSGWTDAAFWEAGGQTFLVINKHSATRGLRRALVQHTAFGAPIGLYITGDDGRLRDGNGDLGLNSFTEAVDLRVLAFNSVVRAPNLLMDHWIDVPGVRDNDTVVLSGSTEQLDRFRVINRAAETYDRLFRQFEPFESRGDFPLGAPSSLDEAKDRDKRIEGVYPDGLPQPLAFVEPRGTNTGYPVVHIKEKRSDRRLFGTHGSRPTLIASELSHALHFSLLSKSQREDLTTQYGSFIVSDLVTGGDATHDLGKETDPTVAFVEALDHFAERFTVFLRRNPSLAIGSATRTAFLQDQFDSGSPASLSGPLATGTVTPEAGLSSSSVEGAVYGAIFLDLARRRGIGLARAVEAYFESKTTTFGQFRSWIEDNKPTWATAIAQVSTTWGM